MNAEKSWKDEKYEIFDSNMSYEKQRNILEIRYKERLTALTDVEGSLLYQTKLLALKKHGIDSETFIKNIYDSFVETKSYGENWVSVPSQPECVTEWLTYIRQRIEEQKENTFIDKEYDIPSFKEYFDSFDIKDYSSMTLKKNLDNDLSIAEDICRTYANREFQDMYYFFKKNKDGILQEIKDGGLIFSSYEIDMNDNHSCDINFLVITPEEQEKDLSLWKDISKKLIECIEGAGKLPSEEEMKQTSLGQLLYQQGYTVPDLVNTQKVFENCDINSFRYNTKPSFTKRSLFLDGLRDEFLDVHKEGKGVLTFLGRMDVENIYSALKCPESMLSFDKNSIFGIFNPQEGYGSRLGTFLEKPAILPAKNCILVIENAKEPLYQFHTIYNEYHISRIDIPMPRVIISETPSANIEKSVKKQPKMR